MSKEHIGRRIRRLRQEAGLTQGALADGRFSESYISLIEAGRRIPTREVLRHVADRLGCSVEQIQGLEATADASQVELLIRRGEWEAESGQLPLALDHLRTSITLCAQLGLPALATRARAGLAKALEMSGRLQEATEVWQALLEDGDADRQRSWRIPATVALSRCYRELGDLSRAIAVGESLWGSIERSTTPALLGMEDLVVVGATLLMAYLELGDLPRAQTLADDLVALAETVNTPMAAGAAYWNAALAAEADGRVGEALRLAEQAQSQIAQTSDVRNKARLQSALGGLHLRMQPPDLDTARQLLASAETVLEQFGSVIDVGYCRTEMARAHLLSGNPRAAGAMASENLDSLQAAGEAPIEVARTLMVLAAASSALSDHATATDAIERAATRLEQAGATRQAATSWRELAELCVNIGETTQAIEAFRKATDLLGAQKTPGAALLDNLGDQRPAEAS